MEVNSVNAITDLKEKPKYSYYSNAEYILIKREMLEKIPKGERF
jgi:hypothetical protein